MLTLFSVELEQEALLQVAGAHTCGVELLNDVKDTLHLVSRCVDVGLEGQYLHDFVDALAQPAVVVERPYQEEPDGLLLVGKRLFAKLLLQQVEERDACVDGNLLAG